MKVSVEIPIFGLCVILDTEAEAVFAGQRMAEGNLLKAGMNRLLIEVTTTMDRDQIGRPDPFFTLDYQPIESTGMYGNITLLQK